MDNRWIELDPIPKLLHTHFCCKLNEREFILKGADTKCVGLYVYHLYYGKNRKLIEYPKNMKIHEHCMVIVATKTKLYGTGAMEPMFICDIKNGDFISLKQIKPYPMLFIGGYGSILNVDGMIHVIGTGECGDVKHLTCNENTMNLSEIFDFKQQVKRIIDVSLFHLRSKRKILMIAPSKNGYIVWNFCLQTSKWQKKTKLPFTFKGMIKSVITLDEKYVIISVLRQGYMYGFDLSDYQLHQSSIPVPIFIDRPLFAITRRLKDEILVIGWIKFSFNLLVLPKDLQELIATWYCGDELHWIGSYSNRHFAIKMEDILSSLQNDIAFNDCN